MTGTWSATLKHPASVTSREHKIIYVRHLPIEHQDNSFEIMSFNMIKFHGASFKGRTCNIHSSLRLGSSFIYSCGFTAEALHLAGPLFISLDWSARSILTCI